MTITILGAGISGLTAAYQIKKNHPHAKLCIIEANNRAGGHIHTLRQEDFVLEQGPRGIRLSGNKGIQIRSFFHELGLTSSLYPAAPRSKRRYIHHHKLIALPTSPLSLLTSPLRSIIGQALLKDWKLSSFPLEEQSWHTFAHRHFGETFTTLFIKPFIAGIWAGDIAKLSTMATAPELIAREQHKGSLLRSFLSQRPSGGRATLCSFTHGMQALPERLAELLSENLVLNTPITHIEFLKCGFHIHTTQGSSTSDIIISALPAPTLSSLFSSSHPSFSQALSHIHYAPMAVITLAYKKTVHTIRGFGYLNVQQHPTDILGVVFNEQTFPGHAPQGMQSLTVMLGGATYPHFEKLTAAQCLDKALEAVSQQLGITTQPDITHVKIIPQAIPQYNMGYHDILKKIQQHCPQNMHLTGNFMGGVSLVDSILHAMATVKNIK